MYTIYVYVCICVCSSCEVLLLLHLPSQNAFRFDETLVLGQSQRRAQRTIDRDIIYEYTYIYMHIFIVIFQFTVANDIYSIYCERECVASLPSQ